MIATRTSGRSTTRRAVNQNGRRKPVKKLVIRGFKVGPQLPEDFEQKTWEKLRTALEAVQQKESTEFGEEELYQATEALCTHKLANKLYENVKTAVEQHIKNEAQKLISRDLDSYDFLEIMNLSWQDHCESMLYIRGIFLYLDRTYVIQNQKIRSLWDMGLKIFVEHIATNPEIQRKTVNGLLELIERERNGEMVDTLLANSLVHMYTSLQVYPEVFEQPFLRVTTEYYTKEGIELMESRDVPEYLLHVKERIQEEQDRVNRYLDASTQKPLISVLENCLLVAHEDRIIEKGFDKLMATYRHEYLSCMYSLYSRIKALGKLRAAFNSFVKASGSVIVTDEQNDSLMVQSLLDFKEKLDVLIKESFESNPDFMHSQKEAFEHFINIRHTRSAELLAKFVDSKLRSGNKGMSEDALENLLDQVMTLFRFINGKDVFEAFYKKDLAKRLLLGKSASFDAEKSMISKLKTECGSGFTSKLEGMFKDVDLSKDIMVSFKQSAKHMSKLTGDIDVNVFVLRTGYWPNYTPIEVKLPKKLAECQEVFREFYVSKYSGKRLFWQNTLGHCVLKATFAQGKKELFVSLFQTVVLMLFNETNSLSYEDISDATGIEPKELKRTLLSLACGRVRPLVKRPKGKTVEPKDTFIFNSKLRHKYFRIKINSIQLQETPEENKKTKEGVFQDRQYQIDAAVVRIMKTRKSLSHTLLLAELYKQLKFPLRPIDIKKRIESLIDREYLERDTANASVYNYLA
eukprot:CAMPEP_0174254846 /NCGR_PEP_ID=MMETSP0439-20130205/4193_1 /TAXON_ID=0 /ORGANISM="Stereomyxa ramosa, Strain Chinc5" /LENGTH=744 /DNA_ID=CAMNT_0015336711 /DNA_START=181 /DNA_END=2415 /DNA_ORIENTATION=-